MGASYLVVLVACAANKIETRKTTEASRSVQMRNRLRDSIDCVPGH